MMTVQRKYKIIKMASLKELSPAEVNQLIQREYKDKEGFIFSILRSLAMPGGSFF